MRKLGKLTAIVLGTLLAGSMAFGLVGCGGGPQEGQTTIRFWYTASISENRIMQNMINGKCDENWAKQNHNLWYAKVSK